MKPNCDDCCHAEEVHNDSGECCMSGCPCRGYLSANIEPQEGDNDNGRD